MFREFVQLVSEAVDTGYQSGVELFMESLEIDLNKMNYLNEHGINNVIGQLFNEAGIEVDVDAEELNEEAMDAALAELENQERSDLARI